MNHVALIGRLVAEPHLKYTPNGTAVTTFRLAVRRNYKNQKGEYEADFINCVVYGKAAEMLAQSLVKGQMFAVNGRLHTREYEYQGQRRYTFEVVVSDFTFIERRQNGNGNGAAEYGDYQPTPDAVQPSVDYDAAAMFTGKEVDPGSVPF